jgi:aminoglycoside phosphotransferase family enzyme
VTCAGQEHADNLSRPDGCEIGRNLRISRRTTRLDLILQLLNRLPAVLPHAKGDGIAVVGLDGEDLGMPIAPAASKSLDGELEAKVRFLLQPASYPEPTQGVRAIETHMSWVFLTDRFAYKLKKPVRFPFLDFSTIELRKHFCEEEIRLNRRLAPRVYIGTLPVTVAEDGAMSIAGAGPAIDWLVKMHRLDADRMLDYAIQHGTATREDIDRLAWRLAAFYRAAPPVEITPLGYRQRFEADVAENLEELRKFPSVLEPDAVERIHSRQTAVLRDASRLFDRRVAEHRIVEAHGDLRPEHVLLEPEPQIIDCLEFKFEFRLLDPADELAFLAVECEMLGAPGVGVTVLDRYRQCTGDDPPPRLIDFYKCYRACLRSKISIWHLLEPKPRDPARWPALAKRYLELADRYSERLLPTA